MEIVCENQSILILIKRNYGKGNIMIKESFEVFSTGAELSLNSANSGNLINH